MKRFYLTAVIWPEGRRYVSSCPEIGIASFGDSPAVARQALKEVAALWLANAERLGILHEMDVPLENSERYVAPMVVTV